MIRVLHVVNRLNRGGVEAWLMNVLRHIDRQRFRLDFLVSRPEPGVDDEEARALGARILPGLHRRWIWSYGRNFRRLIQEFGPYDIIHAHAQHFCGYVLRLASKAGIPVRIAHSHVDTFVVDPRGSLFRRWYVRLGKRWTVRYATLGLAVSDLAGTSLFGPDWKDQPARQFFFSATDFSPFQEAIDTNQVRAELGIPPDAFVLGHVGRFVEQKNHEFLLEIASATLQRKPSMRLLLIGDGPLRSAMQARVNQGSLRDRTIFTGLRSDVPRLMRGAMDVFVFPSRWEGLGLALLEAQAAGLPCVLSDVVPTEADVIDRSLTRLSLTQSAASWAETLLRITQRPSLPATEALRLVMASPFHIRSNVRALEELYRRELGAQVANRTPRLRTRSGTMSTTHPGCTG
jgi:glycosyltransferase involved in cell wall biosynthesis